MLNSVRLNFLDGEIVDYSIAEPAGNILYLTMEQSFDIDFIFCNVDGSPLDFSLPEKTLNVQVLLSCRDRILSSAEQQVCWRFDSGGFFVLPLKNLVFASAELDNVMQKSFLEIEPDFHGRIDCELSLALYTGNILNNNMQLFFTINSIIKQ